MSTGYTILCISVALIVGLISNRLIRLLHLPNVTGYLIVGILLGPYFFNLIFPSFGGILTKDIVKSFGIIVDIALGFIAFSIGGEFKISNIKKLGKRVITVTFLQAFGAMILVDLGLSILCLCMGNFKENLALILTLGAVATATAPAATLMVIKQYKAKGPVTDTLLPVVALDDAIGLMLFSISFAIAQVFAKQYAGIPGAGISVTSVLLMPLLEIGLSIGIGALIGAILTFGLKFFKSRANRLMCIIAAVFLSVAVCTLSSELIHVELSSLLTCMMVGAVFCNLRKDAVAIIDNVDRWTPALFMLFFILSGAELDLGAFANVMILVICLVYVVCRSMGKYFGAFLGCKLEKMDKNVTKFLGFTLLPQAGVAIGMARSSSSIFSGLAATEGLAEAGVQYLSNLGVTITAVVLCATMIYELFGPVITKIALTKAGEIQKEKKESNN